MSGHGICLESQIANTRFIAEFAENCRGGRREAVIDENYFGAGEILPVLRAIGKT